MGDWTESPEDQGVSTFGIEKNYKSFGYHFITWGANI